MKKNTILRILLVDDDADDYFLTSDLLRKIEGTQVLITWAKSFDEALKYLDNPAFEILFFDYKIGGKTGLDLLQWVNQRQIYTPVVILTGRGDKDIDEKAMQLGAMDYLIKGELDTEKLERCMRYSLEKAKTLKKLKESEAFYREIFHVIKEPIVITTPEDGTLLYCNPAVTELIGYTSDELKTIKTPIVFGSPEKRQAFAQTILNQGYVEKYEVWVNTKNGEKKLCQIDAQLRTNSQDEKYFVGVVHDITAIKKAEQEALIAEKIAAMRRLVKTLAHEVRNPLTNIMLSTEQIQAELTDSELHIFIDIIKRNTNRIGDLIAELLNSHRPSELSLSQHSGVALIEESLTEALDRISLKNITLYKNLQQDALLEVDKDKIKISILNLLINAIEAIENDKGELRITCEIQANWFVIRIADNGVGISPDHLSRLFEPYFTSKRNGLGLGLSSTLNIVQAHQGKIEVDSVPGHGSSFAILLPCLSTAL